MCGIAGILSFDGRPVSPGELRAMTDVLVHRGPDDEGFFVGRGVGLGMRRLSIIDLETGQQPVANEDGTVHVVQNGEIYNFRELRRELEARGHAFTTAGDTEVLVHLYEEHGPAFVERLRGMFAFALWDGRRRRLLLGRDRLGIKPLYFGRFGERLVFASELKAILELPDVPRRLDWTAVEHLFAFMTTPEDRSVVAGVAKLEPACLLVAEAAGVGRQVRIHRYWEPPFDADPGPSVEEWGEAIRATLAESVRLHMVSDVPVGAFLSGGVDSSSVVGAMAGAAPGPVRTFSIGFREGEYDELDYARLASRAFGARHREQVLDPDALGILEELAWFLDEPFGDSSALPTFMVSKLAAREVKVVLSGDGGDELFAGYDRYVEDRREAAKPTLPAPLRRLLGAAGTFLPDGFRGRERLRHLALVGGRRYVDSVTLFKADQRARLFQPEIAAALAGHDPAEHRVRRLEDSDVDRLTALQRLDLATYLPLDILTKVDRMSMAHSLETRVPLLDHRLVELAARIPPELKLQGETTKYVFKQALEGRVPREILYRPKRGFAVPLEHWFRGRLGPLVEDLLLGAPSRGRGFFREESLRRLLTLHRRGRPVDLHLWTLLSFELWCRTFLDRPRRQVRPSDNRELRPAVAAGSAVRARS